MAMSGPSLLTESTDPMMYVHVRAIPTYGVYQLYDTNTIHSKQKYNEHYSANLLHTKFVKAHTLS